MSTRSCTLRAAGLLVAGAAVLIPGPILAQTDFLVKRPGMTFSVFGGWAMPEEGSGDDELFAFTREHLTVEEGDFSSPVGMVELAARVTEHLDVALGLERSSRTVGSSMRHFETLDERPIPQSTHFSSTRVLASARVYLLPRGRSISRFAWVPYRWSPYIGGGGGLSTYKFSQSGDFVDFETLDIWELEMESKGKGLSAHALAGAQLSLNPRFLLRGEYRYLWGSGDVDQDDYEGFDEIDLSGSSVLLGVAVRF